MNSPGTYSLLIIIVLLSATHIGCQPDKPAVTTVPDPGYLEGSWKLIQTLEIGHEDSTDRRNAEDKIYLKHLTPTHFTWVEFDKKENRLIGTGGGTYSLQGSAYTEYIDFFYPPGSSELGQAIPFTARIVDGKWHHKGVVKIMEFDPDKGENVPVDTSIIDEIWEKVIEKPNTQSELDINGTWELASYKVQGDSVYSEYPSFTGVLRHITPTHYLWVYYNKDGDEVLMQGGGTYSLAGNTLTETVDHAYSSADLIDLGVSFPFDCRVDGDRWYHTGNITVAVKDSVTGQRTQMDTLIIDEVWKRVAPRPSM